MDNKSNNLDNSNKEPVEITENRENTENIFNIYPAYGSKNKNLLINALAYDTLINNDIIAVYKIKDIDSNDNAIIYSMAYIGVSNGDQIDIEYICPSGSVISIGGEFRSTLLAWKPFIDFINNNTVIKDIYDFTTDNFRKLFYERRFDLNIEYIYKNHIHKKYSKAVEKLCEEFKIHMYVISWLNFYHDIIFEMEDNHLNDIYKNTMLKYKKSDERFFKSMYKKFGNTNMENFYYLCNNLLSSSKKYTLENLRMNTCKISQKMTILFASELKNMFNVEYGIWRELAINAKVSDLVLNKITNGFALSNNWFLFKIPKNIMIFDNPKQYDRLDRSQLASKILELLNQAKYLTTTKKNLIDLNVNTLAVDIINTCEKLKKNTEKNKDKNIKNKGKKSKKKKDKKQEIVIDNLENNSEGNNSEGNNTEGNNIEYSDKPDEFNYLGEGIDRNIIYTEDNIVLSDVVLNMMSEYLGKTVYDMSICEETSIIFSSTNYPNFRKYMFQLCYNLYCLNTLAHTIHGDLHMNNMIINPMSIGKKITIKDPKIIYEINEETYVFNDNFHNLCIIDFDNSIIIPEKYNELHRKDVPLNVSNINNIDNLLNNQVNNLLHYLYKFKPAYKQNNAVIENHIMYHFNHYFKILSALDIYSAAHKLLTFSEPYKKKGRSNKSIKLLENIKASADYDLVNTLEYFINNKNYEDIRNMEWPIHRVIKECFYEDLAIPNTNLNYNITDIYKYSDSIPYSLLLYNKFPPNLTSKEHITEESKKNLDNKIKERKNYEKTFINSLLKMT